MGETLGQVNLYFKVYIVIFYGELSSHNRKRIYCDVEGCYFKSYLPKIYRRHMRAGKHGEKRPRSMNAVTIEAMKTTGAK